VNTDDPKRAASTHVANLITNATMFGPLLEADPSFIPTWKAFAEEWKDESQLP
jgi:hypothetical protein